MKILLLNQTFYPDNLATSQQVTDLAVRLVERGNEVTVLTGRRGYENQAHLFSKKETHQGIKILRAGSFGLGKARFFMRFLDAISFDFCLAWKLLFIPAQDIVVSFTSPPLIGVFGTIFCLLKGGKNVQWLMDINPDIAIQVGYLSEKSLVARVLTRILEWTLRLADQTIVLDRWMKKCAISHGVEASRIEIIPPWPVIKRETSATREEIERFKEEHGLAGKFVLLYSGNHSVVHPLDTILNAALVLKDDPKVKFVFIGFGLRTREVASFKKTHQLNNILQLPLQSKEKYAAALGAAGLQLVVMGEKVVGLVHPSKIYSVLSSGKPYLVIGPEKSHPGDILVACPFGFRVDHLALKDFLNVIDKVQALAPEALEAIRIENPAYVSRSCGLEFSLEIFEKKVLETWRVDFSPNKQHLGPPLTSCNE